MTSSTRTVITAILLGCVSVALLLSAGMTAYGNWQLVSHGQQATGLVVHGPWDEGEPAWFDIEFKSSPQGPPRGALEGLESRTAMACQNGGCYKRSQSFPSEASCPHWT